MSTIVVMPGGFHPFHAGHAALYDSVRRAFPGAEVFVAATNDTSTRPFPFQIKEKLAKLAGVEPGHFVQVKSPFQAKEITAHFNPEVDQLIFVRSEKDADKPPQAGGVKKDGSPSYLQPLLGAKKLEPFSKRAYMAYLPTVEFGPGMTSATEIRTAWPKLNEKRKTALVMSLYPATQKNPALAANVVKMLDTAMGGDEFDKGVAEDTLEEKWSQKYKSSINCSNPKGFSQRAHCAGKKKNEGMAEGVASDDRPEHQLHTELVYNHGADKIKLQYERDGDTNKLITNIQKIAKLQHGMDIDVDTAKWIAGDLVYPDILEQGVAEASALSGSPGTQGFVGGMYATYQNKENQPVSEDYLDESSSGSKPR